MIEQDIADNQKKQLEQEANLEVVYARKFELKKELTDIMETLRKGEYVLSKLKIEERMKIREFWNQKNNR